MYEQWIEKFFSHDSRKAGCFKKDSEKQKAESIV